MPAIPYTDILNVSPAGGSEPPCGSLTCECCLKGGHCGGNLDDHHLPVAHSQGQCCDTCPIDIHKPHCDDYNIKCYGHEFPPSKIQVDKVGEAETHVASCFDLPGYCHAELIHDGQQSAVASFCCGDCQCSTTGIDVPEKADYCTADPSDAGALKVCPDICCQDTGVAPYETRLQTHVNAVKRCMSSLRKCCAVFDTSCKHSCCHLHESAEKSHHHCHHQTPVDGSVTKVTTFKSGSKAEIQQFESIPATSGNKLTLDIRGMDCSACTSKVGKSLRTLPSVVVGNVNYFKGRAELHHDPTIISTIAIAKHLARTTGFTVVPLDSALQERKKVEDTIYTFPRMAVMLSFRSPPPPDICPGVTIKTVNSQAFEVSMDTEGPRALRVRDVMRDLVQFGPSLLPPMTTEDDGARKDLRAIFIRTVIATICCIPVLVLSWAPLPRNPVVYGAVSLVFTSIIQVVAYPILSAAVRTLVFTKSLDMDLLVAISTTTAYIFSIIAYAFEVSGRPIFESFFETSCLLVTLIYVGKSVQALVRHKTGSALRDLQKMQTSDVLLLEVKGLPPRTIDIRLLHRGDMIRVLPDSRIATDGVVHRGTSEVDESSVTGESLPVVKTEGSSVVAGTLNLGGTLELRVTRLAHENSLSSIARLIEEAQSSRAPIQDIADRIASYIIPATLTIACVTFFCWVLVNRFIRHRNAAASSLDALTYTIAVLVVACPCAIGLAIPIAVSVCMRTGASHGILFRSVEALQVAHSIDTVIFDKTGTITTGCFGVTRAELVRNTIIIMRGGRPYRRDNVEELVRALLEGNKHPIAKGVLAHIGREADLKVVSPLMPIQVIPGKGVEAKFFGLQVRGGSAEFTGTSSHPLVQSLEKSGLSIFCVSLEGILIAAFGLADTVRDDSAAIVSELRSRGKRVFMLSGDNVSSVRRVAAAVGIPPSQAIAGCQPGTKGEFIRTLQSEHTCRSRILFVGDGTNDSVAIRRADCGVAVANATEVAVSAAGVVLLRTDLRALLILLDIAESAHKRIVINFAWCAVYNTLAIVLASGVAVNARISPQWAGLGELISIFPLIMVGLHLGRKKFE